MSAHTKHRVFRREMNVDEAYLELAMAIVEQAVLDYKTEQQLSKPNGDVSRQRIGLARWFLSPWGQTLSQNNGEYILRKLEDWSTGR